MSKICSIEGCGKKVHGYGLCNSHYRKKLAEHKKRMKEVCVIKGCDCPVVARGLCRKHYIRWYKYGRTTS